MLLCLLFLSIIALALCLSIFINHLEGGAQYASTLTFLIGFIVSCVVTAKAQRWGLSHLELYDTFKMGETTNRPYANFGFYMLACIASIFAVLVFMAGPISQ